MMYINVPVEGIDLQLLVDGNAPVKIEVVDRSEGLPSVQGRPPLSRPADSISYVSGDMTMTHRSFTF